MHLPTWRDALRGTAAKSPGQPRATAADSGINGVILPPCVSARSDIPRKLAPPQAFAETPGAVARSARTVRAGRHARAPLSLQDRARAHVLRSGGRKLGLVGSVA